MWAGNQVFMFVNVCVWIFSFVITFSKRMAPKTPGAGLDKTISAALHHRRLAHVNVAIDVDKFRSYFLGHYYLTFFPKKWTPMNDQSTLKKTSVFVALMSSIEISIDKYAYMVIFGANAQECKTRTKSRVLQRYFPTYIKANVTWVCRFHGPAGTPRMTLLHLIR